MSVRKQLGYPIQLKWKPPPDEKAPPQTSVTVPFVWQDPYVNWCWTACAAMIAQYLKDYSIQKCDFAKGLFEHRQKLIPNSKIMPTTRCCSETRRLDWDTQCVDDTEIEAVFECGSIDHAPVIKGPLEFETLCRCDLPFEAGLEWMSDGKMLRHLVIVWGFAVINEQQYVWIHNPDVMPRTGPTRYHRLKKALDFDGDWTRTWKNFKKR